MTYSEKKKASKVLLDAMYGLKGNDHIKVQYGTGYKGKPNYYYIKAYESSKGDISFSIWTGYAGMNIDSLGPTTAKAYTYDMMSQRTNYVFPLYEMTIVDEDNNPLNNLPGSIGTEKGSK